MLLVVLVPFDLRWAVGQRGRISARRTNTSFEESSSFTRTTKSTGALSFRRSSIKTRSPARAAFSTSSSLARSIPSGSSAQSVPSKTSMKYCVMASQRQATFLVPAPLAASASPARTWGLRLRVVRRRTESAPRHGGAGASATGAPAIEEREYAAGAALMKETAQTTSDSAVRRPPCHRAAGPPLVEGSWGLSKVAPVDYR